MTDRQTCRSQDDLKSSYLLLYDNDAVVVIQVWQIRVDVHTLNNDGNLMDAASIAAISALSHFRRPDVGIQGEEVTVVSRPSPYMLRVRFVHHSVMVVFLSAVQSRGERPHPSEYLPHAHQRQLRLLPAGVRSQFFLPNLIQ